MTQTEMAKLAKEIAAQGAAQPVPWSEVTELAEMRHQLSLALSGGKERKLTFGETVELYKTLDAEQKRINEHMADLKAAVQAAVLMAGVDKVMVGNLPVTKVHREGSRTVKPELLLSHGVAPDTIAACTVVGKSSDFVTIGKAKD
jgi:hypothetical protein